MTGRTTIGAIALAISLAGIAAAQAFDEAKYPDWRGQWTRLPNPKVITNPSWDPNQNEGRAQQPPLTPEYQKIFEASLADQEAGGAGLDRDLICMTAGTPG